MIVKKKYRINSMILQFVDNDGDGRVDEDCGRVSCTQSSQIVGDRIDNDCDGRVDEEICDGFG